MRDEDWPVPPWPMYFSPDGEPMEFMEWALLYGKRHEDLAAESWWRKQTQLDGDVEVSSVWLGLNLNSMPGPPEIWETMIFGGEYDKHCWRYPSRQAALDDHERIIRALRAGCNPEEVVSGV